MSSIMRISGLASGMDIDSIVKQLMTAARQPVNKLYQEKTLLQWKKDDYRAMNTQLSRLRDALSRLRLQSTFLARKAVSSNEAAVVATATNNAATSTYSINVEKIATSTTNVSTEAININPDKKLWECLKDNPEIQWKKEKILDRIEVTTAQSSIKLKFGDTITEPPAKIEVKTKDEAGNEVVKVYKLSGDTGEELVYSLEDSSGSEDQVFLDKTTGELVFTKELAEGSVIEAEYEYNTKKFDVHFTIFHEELDEDGKPQREEIKIEVDAGSESLNTLFRRISSNREYGITLFYDSFQKKVVLSTNRTGRYNNEQIKLNIDGKEVHPEVVFGILGKDENGEFIITQEDTFFKTILKFSETNEISGQNASFSINGLPTESYNNEITINGTTFTLKSAGEATISVSTDTEAILQTIKDFVNTYNEVINTISAKIKEERYRDYPPLTKEQKEEMDENEIKLWEEKAKSGLLRNDPLLRSVLDKMRSAWSNPVAGLDERYDQMTEFGISTGSYLEYGKLYLDEDKLRQALNDDPEAVLKFFTQNGETDSSKGVAQRLYSVVNNAISQLSQKAGNPSNPSLYDNSELAKSIRNLEERIKERERRLLILEQRYWTQFSLMEKYIQRANVQSMWLAQQFMSS